jgi:hypothetical protein
LSALPYQIEEWRNRLLVGEFPYVSVDGIYLKRSWTGEMTSVSVRTRSKGRATVHFRQAPGFPGICNGDFSRCRMVRFFQNVFCKIPCNIKNCRMTQNFQ